MILMATREYKLSLRNTVDDTKDEVLKEAGAGWLESALDARVKEILALPENARGDVVMWLVVKDAV